MPVNRRSVIKFPVNMPVSYRVNAQNRQKDARNVYTNQGTLETRFGISRFNATAFSDIPESLTYFQRDNGTDNILAKDQTILYKAEATGAHTSLKTGLTAGTKHRGVAFNNRHIVAIESDGLFSWDGTTGGTGFTPLGQSPPSSGTAAVAAGGSLVVDTIYQIALTFYATTTGFETNAGFLSNVTTAGANLQIDISSIPNTATNKTIDKVRIYLQNVTTATGHLRVAEINLGTTTHTVDEVPTSTLVPPTTHAAPLAGGGKYLAAFGSKIVYAGNSTFLSEVFISEPNLPDAFDDSITDKTVFVSGQGPITGLAVGLYDNDNLAPYLVAFKRTSFDVYAELGGIASQVPHPDGVGCVSHETIKVINGDIFFMSTQGFHSISNGRLRTVNETKFIDSGAINDIFTRPGFVYEINKSQASNFFSVFYRPLNQWLTFVSEGANTAITKCYNFEFETGGFRPYEFQVNFKAGVVGQFANQEVVYLAGEGGYIYQHSINEVVGTDIDRDGNDVAIDAFAMLYWVDDGDLDSSTNFGPFVMKALAQANPVTVKCFLDYSLDSPTDKSYTFDDPETGFILDISKLDEGVLGDGRTQVIGRGNIFRSGQSLLIGFYKSQEGESMGIIEAQLDISKNGNPN